VPCFTSSPPATSFCITATTEEEDKLTAAMGPVVYFLVLFFIVVHGLSISTLDIFYRWKKKGMAISQQQNVSQLTKGLVNLPRAASPSTSGRSCIESVEIMTATIPVQIYS
jgi:hypothetical protein